MAPPREWMDFLAETRITLSVVTAAAMAVYIAAGHRQKMTVMNLVWPLTALYLGPAAILIWRWFGGQGGRMKGRSCRSGRAQSSAIRIAAPLARLEISPGNGSCSARD